MKIKTFSDEKKLKENSQPRDHSKRIAKGYSSDRGK